METNAEMVKEHGRNLSNIFGRLSSVENEMAEVIAWKERVDMDLYNHGQDGMKTILTKFISDHEAREDEREKALADHDRQLSEALDTRDRRLNITIGILGLVLMLLTLIVGWRTYLDTIHRIKEGDLKIRQIFHSSISESAYAIDKPQDAEIPSQP